METSCSIILSQQKLKSKKATVFFGLFIYITFKAIKALFYLLKIDFDGFL